jgi:hypothetical protein
LAELAILRYVSRQLCCPAISLTNCKLAVGNHLFFVGALRCGNRVVDPGEEPFTGWRCLQSWFERRLGKGRSLKPSWRTAAWVPPGLNAIGYLGVGPAKFLGSARVKSLFRHERGGTMVLTLGLGHRPLAEEILALKDGKAVKCPPRQFSRRMRHSADCGFATPSPLPAGRPHLQRRGAVDLSPAASVRNPWSSSVETRAPIVASPSLDELPTVDRNRGENRAKFLAAAGSGAATHSRSTIRGMASATATGISRLAGPEKEE